MGDVRGPLATPAATAATIGASETAGEREVAQVHCLHVHNLCSVGIISVEMQG